MPSRPSRLLRWLASERAPRGCSTCGAHLLGAAVGQQVEQQGGAALRGDLVAQQRRDRIDQAAFDAGGGRDELALAREAPAAGIGEGDRHRLERHGRRSARRNARVQPTSKPQLAGASGAIVHAALRRATAPRRRRSPAATSWRRRAPAPRRRPAPRRSPAGVAKRSAVAGVAASGQPSQRWRMWKRTPAARRRCSQARSSGAAFMSVGNTRPEVPTKVSMPSPCAHSRSASGPKARSSGSICARRSPKRAAKASKRLGMREVEAAAAGQQELAARPRAWRRRDPPARPARSALRPPSVRRGRRRRRRPLCCRSSFECHQFALPRQEGGAHRLAGTGACTASR